MSSILWLIFMVLSAFQFILLVRVILSWVPNLDYTNPLIKLIYDITEPVLAPIRNMLPPMSGFDLSPLVVFLVISVLQRFIM